MCRFGLVMLLVLPGVVVVWAGLALPPPLWVLKYGPTPGCEPTGRKAIVEGIEFVEIGPGYVRVGRHYMCDLGVRVPTVGSLGVLSYSHHSGFECPLRWTEVRHRFWAASEPLANWSREHFSWLIAEGEFGFPDSAAWVFARVQSRTGIPLRAPLPAEWWSATPVSDLPCDIPRDQASRPGLHGCDAVPTARYFSPGAGSIAFITPVFSLHPDQEALIAPYLVEDE